MVGFGHTDKPDISYAPVDLVVFLQDFIDALGLEKVSMIGLSLGGGIALLYAIRNPERLEKLVLVDSAGLGREMTLPMRLCSISFLGRWLKVSKPVLRRFMKRLVFNPDIITAGLVDLHYSLLSQPGAMRTIGRVLSSAASLAGARQEVLALTRDRLPTVKFPTLIVWGKEDRILPLKHGIFAHRQIAGSRLCVFKQCGHIPNLEKPREFNQLVLKFLDQSSP
jgi:pimeloyl-ACP methyl ester carboxylesterase